MSEARPSSIAVSERRTSSSLISMVALAAACLRPPSEPSPATVKAWSSSNEMVASRSALSVLPSGPGARANTLPSGPEGHGVRSTQLTTRRPMTSIRCSTRVGATPPSGVAPTSLSTGVGTTLTPALVKMHRQSPSTSIRSRGKPGRSSAAARSRASHTSLTLRQSALLVWNSAVGEATCCTSERSALRSGTVVACSAAILARPQAQSTRQSRFIAASLYSRRTVLPNPAVAPLL
mmetsp:Transcript_32108/g.75823  ORF Transcript_32108/g.75823 Transcript_32108/m.75823 type:complete len:235 (+) Transcript_32108:321-1025(+)